jgi:hypothetical protein
MTNLKTSTQIKKERPCYYVDCNGVVVFESESLTKCKECLAEYIEGHKEEVEAKPYNYNICMFSIRAGK